MLLLSAKLQVPSCQINPGPATDGKIQYVFMKVQYNHIELELHYCLCFAEYFDVTIYFILIDKLIEIVA